MMIILKWKILIFIFIKSHLLLFAFVQLSDEDFLWKFLHLSFKQIKLSFGIMIKFFEEDCCKYFCSKDELNCIHEHLHETDSSVLFFVKLGSLFPIKFNINYS